MNETKTTMTTTQVNYQIDTKSTTMRAVGSVEMNSDGGYVYNAEVYKVSPEGEQRIGRMVADTRHNETTYSYTMDPANHADAMAITNKAIEEVKSKMVQLLAYNEEAKGGMA